MASLYLLIPIALLFVILGVSLFYWASKKGQFEDLEKHGYSILFDDPKTVSPNKKSEAETPPSDEQ